MYIAFRTVLILPSLKTKQTTPNFSRNMFLPDLCATLLMTIYMPTVRLAEKNWLKTINIKCITDLSKVIPIYELKKLLIVFYCSLGLVR